MNQVQNLQHIARELLYLGTDGSPIYTDHFRQLNTEVFRLSEALFSMKGAIFEEEAAICLSLLMGYNATIYNDGDKESKIQSILDRSFAVLDHLPFSIKMSIADILLWRGIRGRFGTRSTSNNGWLEKQGALRRRIEVMETLQTMEENSYPCSEIED